MAYADHLYTQRVGFTHHAIDLGDGTVIEYGGKGSGLARVRRVTMEEFADSKDVYVCEYPPEEVLPDEQVVARALTRLEEQNYSVFNNNCEHFAYWCKTGRHWSAQADGLKSAIALGVLVGGAALMLNREQ